MMPGFLLHVGATVLCAHGEQAMPLASDPHVRVGGQPLVTMSNTYSVAGCAMPPPIAGNGPCVTASWVVAATRVRASGTPVLLANGVAICAPTGTPLMVTQTQVRAKGT